MKRFLQTLGQEIYWQLLVLSLMLAALVVLSSGLGYMRISFSDVLRIVLAKLPGMVFLHLTFSINAGGL